jgi:pimeloyl-ACP methyl ester carboxylesterase
VRPSEVSDLVIVIRRARSFLTRLLLGAFALLGACMLAAAYLIASSHTYLSRPTMSGLVPAAIVSQNMLSNEETYFSVRNLEHDCVVLRVVTRRSLLSYFSSMASYCPKSDVLDTRFHASRGGSYLGVSPDGLIWSRTTTEWDWSSALRYSGLVDNYSYLIVENADGNLLAVANVKLRQERLGIRHEVISIAGLEHDVFLPKADPEEWNLPIILISGSASFGLVRQAEVLAYTGSPVLLMNPRPHMAPQCLSDLDPRQIGIVAKNFYSFLKHRPAEDEYILVGLSIGATAALLYEPTTDEPIARRYALSPTIYHFNGSSGFGCIFPDAYWKGNTQYTNFFRGSPAGFLDAASVRLGLTHQRVAIERTLGDMSQDEIEQIQIVNAIPNGTRVFWGGDDDQIPTDDMYQRLCLGRYDKSVCSFRPDAGHTLTYHPVNAECAAFEEEFAVNCSASRKFQEEILKLIVEDASIR